MAHRAIGHAGQSRVLAVPQSDSNRTIRKCWLGMESLHIKCYYLTEVKVFWLGYPSGNCIPRLEVRGGPARKSGRAANRPNRNPEITVFFVGRAVSSHLTGK